MNEIVIRPYEARDLEHVIQLWNECGLVVPWNDPGMDIARKLNEQPELLLVGLDPGEERDGHGVPIGQEMRIVATVMAGYDGHRGWINYLAVHPEWRGMGAGRRMMERAEDLLRSRGCPKINLQVRQSNARVIDFYRRIGYSVDDVVSMGKRLERDDVSHDRGSAASDSCKATENPG